MKGKAYKGLSKRGAKYNFIAKRRAWVINFKESKYKKYCKKQFKYQRREEFLNSFGATWNEMRVYVLLLVDILDAKESKQDKEVSTC